VDLSGADLRRVSITGVRMRETDLTKTRLEHATVRDNDLTGAWMQLTNFTSADLRGSDLSTLDPSVVTLAKAVIDVSQSIQLATALGLDVRPDER
jgi:uncharacterized protein YjbI with pentapeptide repeats